MRYLWSEAVRREIIGGSSDTGGQILIPIAFKENVATGEK